MLGKLLRPLEDGELEIFSQLRVGVRSSEGVSSFGNIAWDGFGMDGLDDRLVIHAMLELR